MPKTATHSIRQAFKQTRVDGDWEQQALFSVDGQDKQFIPIPEIAKIQHGHISARQIKPHLDTTFWEQAFKCAIVRNPFDRFLSVCGFLNRRNADFADNALNWMKSAIVHPRFQQRVLVRPQFEMLCDEDGKLAMDYVGRYESLQDSMNHITDALELSRVELRWKNQRPQLKTQLNYDQELRQLVAEFYAVDFSEFGYSTIPMSEIS